MNEKKIKQWIKPVRKKLHMERAINLSFKVLLVGSLLMLLLSIGAHFFPIPFVEKYLILVAYFCLTISLFASIFMYPSIKLTLQKTDLLGFKERFVTAWELREDTTAEAQLQREELESYIKDKRLSKLFLLRPQYRFLISSLVIAVIAISLLFVPSAPKSEAAKVEELQKQLEEEIKDLEAEKEKLYEKNDLPKDKKEELDKKLEALMKQLEKSKTEEEALKNLAIAKNEMKKLDPKELSKDLKKLGESLQTEGLKDLAKALKNEDMKKIKELLDEIEKNIDPEDLEALKENAKQLSNEELKELLEKLAEALENQDSEGIKEMADAISSMLESAQANSQNASALSKFAQGMQAAINKAGQQMSSSSSISELAFGQSGQGGEGGSVSIPVSSDSDGSAQGDGEGQGEGEDSDGDGDGNGQGNGNGNGNGQGNGQGQGQGAGSGAGQGSTNEDGGYTEESGSISHNNGSGEGKEGTYEALYQPSRLGGTSESSFVKGQKGKGGQSTFESVEGAPIEKGNLVSYTEVSASYKSQASQSMDSMNIPIVMKDLIRDYFTSIE